ncbi:MAG: ABC transporter permease [Vicinamibacterales bacterium]
MTDAAAHRLYARLLRLYPRAFRDRFGDGMAYAFAHDLRAARRAGRRAMARLWLQTFWHTGLGAVVARWPRLDPPVVPLVLPSDATRRSSMRSSVARDLRDAWRALRATPLITVVAVLSLALGIGANAALFSIVDSLMLRSLPVRDPGRLAVMDDGSWTNPIWESLRAREADIAEGLFAWSGTRFNLAARGEADTVEGLWVSGRMFEVLGVNAVLGRTITPADDVRGGGPDGPVAVLGYGFWQRRFGGDAGVIGRTLTIAGVPYTIVGVAPPEFFGPEVGRRFDVAIPIGTEPLQAGPASILDARSTWWLEIMARLRPGQTIEEASARLDGLRPVLRDETTPQNWVAEARARYMGDDTTLAFVPASGGTSGLRSRYQAPLLALMVVVGLVLLIACGNIANLLLARATARRHEFSVRLALGASRWRLARQLLAESVLLAGAGAAIGLAFAHWTGPLLVSQIARGSSSVRLDLSLDWRVVGFTLGIAAITAIVFGVAPALGASRVAPNDALKTQGRGVAGDGRFTLRHALVVIQVALSLALVVAASLFSQTFARLSTLDLGFDEGPLLVVNAGVPTERVEPAARLPLFRRLVDAAAATPGVASATASFITPVSGSSWNTQIEIPDGPDLDERQRLPMLNYVLPGWFETYGTRLLRGRTIQERDRPGAPLVAVVNEAFVQRFFPDREPIGREVVEPPFRAGESAKTYQVVGVVQDAVYRRLREPVPPTMYLPMAQFQDPPGASIAITVRAAAGQPARLTQGLVAALTREEPDLTLSFRPLTDQVEASLTQERLVAMLSGFFGLLALVLAALGLYGVTAYAVSQRRRELGVRLALGAKPAGVVRLVLGRVGWLVGAGVVLGGALSLWASGYVGSLLFGLPPRDPATFVTAALVLGIVGAAAGWLPARRAARLDPARVLREG